MRQILALLFLFESNVLCQWRMASPDSVTVGVGCLLFNQGKTFAGGRSLYVSTDDGQSWKEIIAGGYFDGWVNALASDSNRLYVGTGYGFRFSTDNGTNWSRSGIFTENIRELAAMDKYVIAGTFATNDVYRSTDYGIHWSQEPPLPNVGAPLVQCMYSAYGKFFIGTNGSGSYVSSDSGTTWKQVTGNGITPEPGGGIVLWNYMSLGNNLFLAANNVFCSTDTGASWQLIQGSPLFPMALAKANGFLFAAGWHGVSVSYDSGNTWRNISEGLPENQYCNSIIATNNYLVTAVQSEGIWLRPLSEVTRVIALPEAAEGSFSLSQNYPNPFNPSTVINYRIPDNAFVVLKVYDVLGREIRTIVDEKQVAGTHSAIFNGANLTSGVYFYRLEVGSYRETKKFLLLR